MDWFLYDIDLRQERVKVLYKMVTRGGIPYQLKKTGQKQQSFCIVL